MQMEFWSAADAALIAKCSNSFILLTYVYHVANGYCFNKNNLNTIGITISYG